MQSPNLLSLTALKELEDFHLKAAKSYAQQARDLAKKRNFEPIGSPDHHAFMRAGLYLKKHPDFPNISPELCQSVARLFFVPYERFYCYARSLSKQRQRQIIKARTMRVVELDAKGLKRKRISEMVRLSPARVSQILNPDPDRERAKALGLPVATYKSLKGEGRLKACL